MSEQGKANYEAWRSRLQRVSLNQTANDWDELPSIDRAAWDAGADAVEAWLADAPVDEDMPGGDLAAENRKLRGQIQAVKAIANQHALGDSPRAILCQAVLGQLDGDL